MIEKTFDRGYFMMATPTRTVDYLKLAYVTALTIKLTQPEHLNKVAVATTVPLRINNFKHSWVFDSVSKYDQRAQGMDVRARAYQFSPFKETVFLDSDLLFLNPIDHWWDHMSKYEMYIATHPMTFRNTKMVDKYYRKVFIDNNLPDFYSGFFYFKESLETSKFFHVLQALTDYPELWKSQLEGYRFENIPTDEACALAAKMLDIVEDMSNPTLPFPRFTHMKPRCQGFGNTANKWTDHIPFYYDQDLQIKIGPYAQADILHYTQKDLLTDEFIEQLELKVWNKYKNVM